MVALVVGSWVVVVVVAVEVVVVIVVVVVVVVVVVDVVVVVTVVVVVVAPGTASVVRYASFILSRRDSTAVGGPVLLYAFMLTSEPSSSRIVGPSIRRRKDGSRYRGPSL